MQTILSGVFGPNAIAPTRAWRPRPRALLCAGALLCVFLTLTLALPAHAPALGARGRTFSFAFGAAGSGEGQFDDPTDLAVNESSGDLYVVDAGNERVEVFRPNAGHYEYAAQFKVRSPGAIAIDNSTSPGDPSRGDVFVVGAEEKGAPPSERDLIYVYDPSQGAVVAKLHHFKFRAPGGEELEEEFEDISGVAVDAAGTLWVYWEEEGLIDAFHKQTSKSEGVKLVWEPALRRTPEVEGKFECSAREGFAVAPEDEAFLIGYERESEAEECPGEAEEAPDATVVAELGAQAPAPQTLRAEVDHQDTSGAAIGLAGEVLLDNRESIAAFSSSGALIERFGEGELSGASGLALNQQTDQVLVVESARDEVALFGPEEMVRRPSIDALSASELSPSSSELRARIDPGGQSTEYAFSYGTSDCQSDPGACTALPVGHLQAGFGDREVSVTLSGLSPAATYYYTLTATNASGSASSGPSSNTFTTLASPGVLPDGRAWELVSPPDKQGAAIEAISKSRAGSIQAAADGSAIAWLASAPVTEEPEGNRSLELTQLLSRRDEAQWSSASLETPHEQGRGLLLPSPSEYHYFTPDLSLSLVQPTEPTRQVGGVYEHPPLSPQASEKTLYLRHDPPAQPEYLPLVTAASDSAGTRFGGALEFLAASPDLHHVIFESKVGLTAAAPSAAGLYEWSEGGSLALVSVLPSGAPAPDEPGREPTLGDADASNARGAISSDGTRIFFTEANGEALYLRDSARGETIKVSAAQGNGSTEAGPGGHALPEPPAGHQQVRFEDASTDGSMVFFTDTARLSEESSQEPVGEEPPADLYELELTSAPGQPMRGRLTDLTPDPTAGSADVLNLIPGAASDGSTVYLIANGALTADAPPGDCPRNAEAEEAEAPGASCNLYVSAPDPANPGQRVLHLITSLSAQDAADWGASASSGLPPLQGNLSSVNSSVSPDGRYLAFMSDQSLTGYDNLDAVSGQPDEEVFIYDSAKGLLSCASCNPDRGPDEGFKAPTGVLDRELAGEGLGLLVDRPEIFKGRWLAASLPSWSFNITNAKPSALYQPRYLSDSGRLFFDSADALVPADQNGKEDVYEYEPDSVGSCADSGGCIGLISSGTSEHESAFLDASESGDDVFFATATPLVPTDEDSSFDIYDAHVCSESSPCIQSQSISSEGCESSGSCRPAPTPSTQSPATPPSATFTGPGNIPARSLATTKPSAPAPKPLTRAQKLARALHACHKLRSRRRRQACERLARKRFGPRHRRTRHATDGAKRSRTAARESQVAR